MGKEFILSGIRIITGRRVRRRRREWQQIRQRYDKSPTSKIYTTWACILSDRNIFCTLSKGRRTVGSNAPGVFSCFDWLFTITKLRTVNRMIPAVTIPLPQRLSRRQPGGQGA